MIKFLIQKINGKVVHDFSFTLLESIRFHNWLVRSNEYKVVFFNTKEDDTNFLFKENHRKCIPIGTVEFVSQHLQQFHNLTPKPINVPVALFRYTNRSIWNGNHMDLENLIGDYYVKSNSKIKGFSEKLRIDDHHIWNIPAGNYQISKYINIESEWRAFVYNKKLVGLQNYCGDFTLFPNVDVINEMIFQYGKYLEHSAPIAYTLDVGINKEGRWSTPNTFVIEVHDFFSCGLYGFNNHGILPQMFYKWYLEYINKNKI